MTLTLDYIEQNVSAYASGSLKLVDAVQPTTRPLMDADEFDDWLEAGLQALGAIKSIERSYNRSITSGRSRFDKEAARRIHALYANWHKTCSQLLPEVERFESDGVHLANAAQFKSACAQGIMPGLEHDRIAQALQQTRGRELGEVVSAIRSGTVGQRG